MSIDSSGVRSGRFGAMVPLDSCNNFRGYIQSNSTARYLIDFKHPVVSCPLPPCIFSSG